MANKIFVSIFVIGLLYSMITNRIDVVVNVLLDSPKSAFFLFIDIYSMLIFWGGMLAIIKNSGLLNILSKYMCILLHPLFKRLDKNSEALKYISMNLIANTLSMGSAATPFGIKAMEELNKLNNYSEEASNEMITFLLINTSGLCIMPTALLSIRSNYNSNNSAEIIPYIFIVSLLCTALAVDRVPAFSLANFLNPSPIEQHRVG